MAEDFTRRVARVVAAQMAELTGFDATQESAIEILAELLIRYISEVCTAAHNYAEASHRTDFNVCDLLLALDDLGTSVTDLQKYLSAWLAEQGPGSFDQGFVHPLPSEYPVRAGGKALPNFEEKKEEPPQHIPAWLPAFPDKHTYTRTPAFPGHEQDAVKQHEAIRQTKKQAEKAALGFTQRLLAAPPHPNDPNIGSNPFLQAPAVEVVAADHARAATSGAAAKAVELGKDVVQPASTAFEPLIGSTHDGAAAPMNDARRDMDAAVLWQREQQSAAAGVGSNPTAGASHDFANQVQRQALAFTIKRHVEDAYGGRQQGEDPNRLSGSRGTKRGGRYDTDERKRAETILQQSGGADQRDDDA